MRDIMAQAQPGLLSVWPCLAITALLLGLAATRLMRQAEPDNRGGGGTEHRMAPLDGLRGFLALSVFFHHAVITHAYLNGQAWDVPPSRFYTMAGQASVALFFMITGCLFWARLTAAGGRMDWTDFAIGRAFRIGPLYLAAMAATVAMALARTGFTLHQPVWQVSKELIKWAALGIFGNGPDINADRHTALILAGVVWTLQCEWAFYASLIPLSLFARDRQSAAMLPAATFSFLLLQIAATADPSRTQYAVDAALFAAGMLSAGAAPLIARAVPAWLRSVVALLLLATAGFGCDTAYSPVPILLLAGAFLLFASGADLFGLLTGRPARRLGAISYGVYLLQGLVLTTLFTAGAFRRFAMATPVHYWLMLTMAAVLLVIFATLAHIAVERPGIRTGRRLAASRGAHRRIAPVSQPVSDPRV
jgi:peptidoglycan/LPS O-acetylase OafA/YrhL